MKKVIYLLTPLISVSSFQTSGFASRVFIKDKLVRFSLNQKLLYQLFLSHPDQAFYMQEIGRVLGKKPGFFQRTLNNLEKIGFVSSHFKANARFFTLNQTYPFIDEIKSILNKQNHFPKEFKEITKKSEVEPQIKDKNQKGHLSKVGSRISDFQGKILTHLVPELSDPDSDRIG